MKKLHAILAGIVFIIAIPFPSSCQNSNKQSGSPKEANDSTRVVYLKDTLIDGRMHLEMYNEKKPDKKVIDHLVTVVNPGYTVIFKKAHKSNIKKVHNMRPVEGYANIFMEVDSLKRGLFELEIYPDAPYDIIVKYEIMFTVKGTTKETTWLIDPFLRIP
jgi:hypothetical protein